MVPNLEVSRRLLELLGLFVYGPYAGEAMIVAFFSAENEGADIATFDLYTAPADGIYRLTTYATTIANGALAGALTFTANYSDAGGPGAVEVDGCLLSISGPSGITRPVTVQLQSGTVITLETKNGSGLYDGSEYNAYAVLEFIRALP